MQIPPMPPPRPRHRPRHRLRNRLIGIGLAIVALIGGAVGCTALVGSALTSAARPDSVSSGHAALHAGASPQAAASSPGPSGPVDLHLGDPASVSQDGADAATVAIGRKEVSSRPVDGFSDRPQNGFFVAVHITVRASTSLADGFDINPLDFYALSGRAHFDEGDGNAFEGPRSNRDLNATTLNAGETASGWLLFDLPARHGRVAYAPNLDGPPLAYWKF
ncbi:MAG: hypothetical protein ACRDRJ_47365 [Streptosporangiaceae bacterium]